MEQAQFILKSLFIVRPNPSSHYKLRIVINSDTQQQQDVKKEKQKYNFSFPAGNGMQFQHPFGAIILLERSGDAPSDERYLQIGKANVDFNEVLQLGPSKQPSMNGVIYGTRASNYDKVIAKYSYEVAKRKVQIHPPSQAGQGGLSNADRRKLKFKDHLQKDKLPVLKFKKSILERSNAINDKIRQLSQNITIPEEDYMKDDAPIDKITTAGQISRSPQDNSSNSNYTFKSSKAAEDFGLKLNDKVEIALLNHQYKEIKWMRIKTVKIFAKSKAASLSNKAILLKIQDHYHFRLADIILPLQNNTNNSIKDLPIPIPADSNYLTISATYQEGSWQTLQGYTRLLHSITKTVELFSDSNEEQGFVSLQVLKSKENSFDLQHYQNQKDNFNSLTKKFPTVSTKPLPNIAINPRKQQHYDLYQSIQRKKRNSDALGHSRKSIPVSHHNYSQSNDQSNSRSKRIRNQKNSLQISDLSTTAKIDLSASTKTLSLKIKNIYIHLYDYEASEDLQLNIQANGETQTVDIDNGYSDIQEDPILLTDLSPKQNINVHCYERSSHNLLGSCLVGLQALIKSSTGQMKIFLSRHDILVGYISCDISLYRIKNNQIKAIRKQTPTPSSHIYTAPNEEYELSFQPQTVGYINSLSPPSRHVSRYTPGASFLVEQQNFH